MAADRVDATTEASTLKKTITLAEVHDRARHYPFEVFDEWPIREIREKSIESLEQGQYGPGYSNNHANWLETRIRVLKDDLWRRLLAWYIIRAEGIEAQVRALEFAIEIGKEKEPAWGWKDVSKLIAGKIQRNLELYWCVPSLRKFLATLLTSVESPSLSGYYMDNNWNLLERATRLILKVQDVTFLPLLKELLEKLEQNGLKLFSSTERFEFSLNKAFLREAIALLEKAKEEQTQDLSEFGVYLRKKAPFSGSIIIKLDYPECCVYKPDCSVGLKLEFVLTKAEDNKLLLPLLKECKIELSGEGCEIEIKGFTGTGRRKNFEGIIESLSFLPVSFSHLKSFSHTFNLFPTLGNNRFYLALSHLKRAGTPEITIDSLEAVRVETVGYILCE